MTLNELISALERAEGPSDDLDDLIADTLGVRGWGYDDEGLHKVMDRALPYTSSIDDALTLVPERVWVDVRGISGKWPVAEYGHHTGEDVAGYGQAPGAALSICIAALKARAT